MKTHIGYVKNYARPEACMAEGYLAGECISFCLDFLKNHTPVEEAVKRNEDVESDDVLLEVVHYIRLMIGVLICKS